MPEYQQRGVSALVVAVPARNEEVWIPRCVAALRRAVDSVEEVPTIRIAIGADSCDDATATVAHAADGLDAIAGVVALHDDGDLATDTAAAFADGYPVPPGSHGHVHGANLGVRGSAYLAAGGFPDVTSGEDWALWRSLALVGPNPVVPPRMVERLTRPFEVLVPIVGAGAGPGGGGGGAG